MQLTERITFYKFVGILKLVKIREFQELFKFVKFEFSTYDDGLDQYGTEPFGTAGVEGVKC